MKAEIMNAGVRDRVCRASSARETAMLLGAALCVALAGCVARGSWKAEKPLAPEGLAVSRTLATAQLDAAAWPADIWWRSYGDSQLDGLIDEALAGSPSLEIAQARLRAAQAEATRAGGARQPTTTVDAEATRQRYPEHGLYPPPFAGNSATDARIALDFSYDIDLWGRNRAA